MKVEIRVALLTESVDRNAWQHFPAQLDIVALLTESVDRNICAGGNILVVNGSLSSRRAWIEIRLDWEYEGGELSLSSRRAWIEMPRS